MSRPRRPSIAAVMEAAGEDPTGVPDAVVVPAPRWLARRWAGRIAAMTLPGRIVVAPDRYPAFVAGEDPELLRHEVEHLRQWHRDGILRFLVRYLADYGSARMAGMPHHAAYRAIRYEVAARARELPE